MGDCCNCHSEVSRDGSGQLSRFLKALDPAYARIDDHSINDLLVFAKRYANQIRFYDIPGSEDHEADKTKISWREFFKRDMAVIAASISLTDTVQLKKDYDELRIKVDTHPSHTTFDDLFDPILGMIAKIDGWYAIAIPENPLYADLQLAINSNLKSQAQQIVAYEKGFNYVDASHPLNLDYSAIKNKDVWGLNVTINADITIYQGTDTEDKIRSGALYVDDIFNSFYNSLNQLLTSSESYMQFALEKYPAHQPHMALFIAFLQLFNLAQQQMNGITQRMLDFYYHDVLHLTSKPSIPDKVHIVFELAKDVVEYDVGLGTLLKAGKDAGGKDQLYLTESDLVVNQAKVKEIKNIFIDKTSFTVKSADGNTLTRQIINNIYARPVANSKDGFGEQFTDANAKWSTFGKERASLNASANLCDQVALLDDADRTDIAEIGFAIASPQLVLQSGNRLLQIQLGNDSNSNNLFAKAKDFESKNPDKSFFKVSLTGDKSWIDAKNRLDAETWNKLFIKYKPKGQSTEETLGIFNPALNITEASYFLDDANNAIAVFLPPTEQAIINFDAKLHTGYAIQTTQPVVKVLINSSAVIDEDDYKNFRLNGISIRTKVGSINPSEQEQSDIIASGQIPSAENLFTYHLDGLKKLVLQNKDGVLPPDKPFDPFTAYPFPGRSLYIGSDEIFNKPFRGSTDALAINIQKTLDAPAVAFSNNTSTDTFNWENYTVSLLKQRQWNPIKIDNAPEFFKREQLTENILNNSVLPTYRKPIDTITEWKSDTEKGFIKIDLREPTPPIITIAAEAPAALSFVSSAAADNITILQRSQNLAPGLEIKEISVSYDSTVFIEMGVDQFFHIYPFGTVETYLSLGSSRTENTNDAKFADLDKLKNGLLVNAQNALLPQFNFLSPYSKYYNNAAFTVNTSVKKLGDVAGLGLSRINTNSKSANAVRLMLSARSDADNSSNQYSGDLQEGMLFIGLEKSQPLQSISMLFQFAEGSAENEDDDPPTIHWSYLSYNEWKPMKAENITSDGTYGFQTTGIIKIDIPADASSNNTIITNGLIWLCASVNENANRIPQLIKIVTQAVEAQFDDQNNDPLHFDNALPANSISKLATPVAQISKVQQPFASFDGKHQEVGKEFYTRVSERLRHKGRAINAWDYEHLVLDRFPSIYKVKCITHTDPNCLCTTKENTGSTQKHFTLSYNSDFNFDAASEANIASIISDLKSLEQLTAVITIFDDSTSSAEIITKKLLDNIIQNSGAAASRITTNVLANGTQRTIDVRLGDYITEATNECCGPQIAPGHVLLIPIANLKNRNAANPLQPKTSRRTLIAIQEYLKTKTSPFVHVHAKNPVYEQIIVSFKVQFYSGTDKGFYIKKLNDEIVHFLTPWAFDENAEVKFNQKIYASSIINFIEERSYVDFITDFVMGVCCNECCTPEESEGIGVMSGRIFDSMQKPLAGIKIKIKELNKIVTSAQAVDVNNPDDTTIGTYKIENIPPGIYTLLAYFSIFNIAKQGFTINEDGTAMPATIDFYEGTGNRQEDIEEYFRNFCGCDSVEKFLKYDPNFKGDIVAEPCTSRSLLVSVRQHIVIPFEEDDEPTPCEKRKAAQSGNTTSGVLTGITNATPAAPTPIKPVVKKINETSPVKSAVSPAIKKAKATTNKTSNQPKKPK